MPRAGSPCHAARLAREIEEIMSVTLIVYFQGVPAGRLWLDEKRRFVFQYEPGWVENPKAAPLSLSLPLRVEPFEDDLPRAFFSNLLPEAAIRQAVARKLGISELNDFALLEAIGGECAGAVSVLPEGEKPGSEHEYTPLNEQQLHEVVKALPSRPLLAGEEGVRLSLAGAQNKLPVYIEDDRIYLPKGGSPSSHILKPPIRDLEGTVENEAFCMMLAKQMGLPVPGVKVLRGMDTLFFIERYDRRRDEKGKLMRLHQEDFCQALGVSPDQKYESEGGPSFARCFGLLKGHSASPAADQKALLNWVVFNLLIGNADAHAKNLALLFTDDGPRLAPFYDLLCTAIYEGITDKLAMKIGGENRPDWVQVRHWEIFAEDVGIKSRLVTATLRGMAEGIVKDAEDVSARFEEKFGESAVIQKILAVIKKRSRGILMTLK
jgi:serine/threonine-protein kinase HipA